MTIPRLPFAVVALALLVAAAGCGSSGSSGDANATVAGAVATNGVVTPEGGAYSYDLPAGWHSLPTLRVDNATSKTHDRSAVARKTGLIYVFATDRSTRNPMAYGKEYQDGLKQIGLSSTALALTSIGGAPAIIYEVKDVPIAGGGTGQARKILVFGSDAVIVISCQWDDDDDQAATLQACSSVRKSMQLSP